jgi:hypothetical protein
MNAVVKQLTCIFVIAVFVSAQSASAQDAKDAKPESQGIEPRIPRPNMSDESALQQTAFSQAVADALLRRLAHGLQGHSLPQTLSMFAPALLDSGLGTRVHAAFSYYESFHIYYKTVQVTGDGEQKGTIIADFDLESRPQQADLASRREHARMRFEIERIPSARGNPWRIVAMDPDRFFFAY